VFGGYLHHQVERAGSGYQEPPRTHPELGNFQNWAGIGTACGAGLWNQVGIGTRFGSQFWNQAGIGFGAWFWN